MSLSWGRIAPLRPDARHSRAQPRDQRAWIASWRYWAPRSESSRCICVGSWLTSRYISPAASEYYQEQPYRQIFCFNPWLILGLICRVPKWMDGWMEGSLKRWIEIFHEQKKKGFVSGSKGKFSKGRWQKNEWRNFGIFVTDNFFIFKIN
jgi:hypothetical protein